MKDKSFLKFLIDDAAFFIFLVIGCILMFLMFAYHSYSETHPEICNSYGCAPNPYTWPIIGFLLLSFCLILYSGHNSEKNF